MKFEKVGEFEVHALTVEQGLDLLNVANNESAEVLQKEIIMKCVTKNNQPIGGTDFRSLMPLMKQITQTAFRLNGFISSEDQD